MRTVRKILVAVKDPYLRSLPAVAKAAQLARACKARLELFHAMATPVCVDVIDFRDRSLSQFIESERSQTLRRLEVLARRLRRRGNTVTVSCEPDFPAYEAIIRRARSIGADLIVADCHAGRHTAAALLRLTDWELLRHSPVPVLLIKSPRLYRHPAVLAAVDPLHAFAKPGKLDDEILRAAAILNESLRGTLHAVHAYPVTGSIAAPADLLSSKIMSELQEQAKTVARKGLERVLRNVKIRRSRQHLVARPAMDGIQSVARSTRSAVVVMGAISRSGLKRLFIGNTAERVLDVLQCDVLIVKPRRFASHVQRRRRGVRFTGTALPFTY